MNLYSISFITVPGLLLTNYFVFLFFFFFFQAEDGIRDYKVTGVQTCALPISWVAADNEALSCINCDAHADVRAQEGRHSGNPFSYAKEDRKSVV